MRIEQEQVKAFKGENRYLPDELLSDAVSPDAQNVDYSRGTILKRQGFVKLHSKPALEGAVRVSNAGGNRCIWIPNHTEYGFTGSWTVELVFKGSYTPATSPHLLQNLNTGTLRGFRIYLNGANQFAVGAYYGGVLYAVAAVHTVDPSRVYHLAARWQNNTLSMLVTDLASGTQYSGSVATAGAFGAPDRPIFVGAGLGATPGNQTIDGIFDEIRIWKTYRGDGDLAAARYRELRDDELADGNLIGNWRLSDSQWNMVTDFSRTMNHGTFYSAGPSFERGLLPDAEGDGFAARFDGVDDYGSAPYHADYAPVLNTGNKWSIEFWVRLDNPNYFDTGTGSAYILHLGGFSTGNGAVFAISLPVTGTAELTVSYSTTTTKSNFGVATGYILHPGVPVHVCVTRDAGTVRVYINGELVITDGTATTENGPTSSSTYGMFFGGRNSAGTWDAKRFCPVTLDEVRLWKSALGQDWIKQWMNRTLPDSKHADLLGCWRFDQTDKEYDETGRAPITFSADGNKPRWSYGQIYPIVAQRMQMLAPLSRPSRGNETLAGAPAWSRELLAVTRSSVWTLMGGVMSGLRQFDLYGEPALSDWVHYRDWLVFVNGIDTNFKYRGQERPQALTIAQPAALTAGIGAVGALTGAYFYRVAFRNSLDGTESLAGAPASVTLAAQQAALTNIPVSSDTQVNQRRLYRLDPGSTVYRYLTDINDNTTTTYNDNTASVGTNEIINDRRGHVNPCAYCEVYANRLFLAGDKGNPNRVYFSEAGLIDFPAFNFFDVDRGDGDEITGLRAALGGLVIFKRSSIHFVSGEGPTTFQPRPFVPGKGCVNSQTIAEGPGGLYYLDVDGVYRLRGEHSVEPIGLSQLNLFETMDPELYRFACACYVPARHSYLVSFDIARRTGGDYVDRMASLFTYYWRLAGDGTDAKGLANATSSGTTAFVQDSLRGRVLSVSGAGFMQVANGGAQMPTMSFSVGLWLYCSSTAGGVDQGVLSITDQGGTTMLEVSYRPNQRFLRVTANLSMTDFTALYTVRPNEWVHFVATCEAGSLILYINGKRYRLKTTGTFTPLAGNTKIIIGDGNTYTTNFVGKIANAWYIKDRVLTPSEVQDIYEYENGLNYKQRSRVTLLYDEKSQSWAKWDRGFDYFAVAQHSGNRTEVLAASRGFVHRLFEGDGDGYAELQGSFITKSGSVTGFSGAILTDATAMFPIEGNGLAGVDVVFVDATSGVKQRVMVVYNTATTLYFDKRVLPITGTYHVGPIDFYWESRWLEAGTDAWMKRWHELAVRMTEESTPVTVTLKYKSDTNEGWITTTFTNADELYRFALDMRGRLLKLRFEQLGSDSPVEITSFRPYLAEKTAV